MSTEFTRKLVSLNPMLRCSAALACAALISTATLGCATPQDSGTGSVQAELQALTLSTAPSADADGTLVLRLKNDAKRPLKVNLCQATLHAWQGEEWQPSQTQPQWLCPERSESVVVNPGGERQALFNPADLEPGRYRFTTPIEMPVGLDFKTLTSAAFDIVPPTTDDTPAESAPSQDDAPSDDAPSDDAPSDDAPSDDGAEAPPTN